MQSWVSSIILDQRSAWVRGEGQTVKGEGVGGELSGLGAKQVYHTFTSEITPDRLCLLYLWPFQRG